MLIQDSVFQEIDAVEPYKTKLVELIQSYAPAKQVLTSVTTKIVLTDSEAVWQRPRRLAPKEKEILKKQVKEWLENGIIHPSKSEYTSSVVIVPKKDGSDRVCVDFRQLNKIIVKDRFPMPLIDDCIDELAGARVYSVLDLKNRFFHVPVAEECRKFTAFVTPFRQYEFNKTPFGLCNSPASFVRFINEVFQDLICEKIVFTYVDDVIIPGVDEGDAYEKLVKTLEVASQNGLQVNWKKCKFLKKRIEFLGHEIEDGHIYPSPEKIKAVQRFPVPESKRDIQSFLGLTGYFRKFIKDYARIAQPLTDLLKDSRVFSFGQTEDHAFFALKNVLSKEPVLKIYDPRAITELHTDASKEGYGAVLMQKSEHEKNFHAVYFMSHKTTDSKKKLHSYELEILAIITAFKKFRVYLLGLNFKIITDCEAVQKTVKKQNLSPKITRWTVMLEEFSYEIEHRSDERLKHADALSRYLVMIVEDRLTALIKKAQEKEERLKIIKQILINGPYEDYFVKNDILMKKIGEREVLVLPTSLQMEIIRRTHENGHFGVRKMTEELKKDYYITS